MFAQIDVLVAVASPDVQAEGIAAAVATRSDMTLAANRVLSIAEATLLLRAMPRSSACAVILVGVGTEDEDEVAALSSSREDVVMLRVDVISDLVAIAVRDVGLDALLRAVRELARRPDRSARGARSPHAWSAPSSGGGINNP